MLLTNEQRAHDLAVSLVNYQLSNLEHLVNVSDAEPLDGVLTITKDVMEMYLDNYNSCLKALSKALK